MADRNEEAPLKKRVEEESSSRVNKEIDIPAASSTSTAHCTTINSVTTSYAPGGISPDNPSSQTHDGNAAPFRTYHQLEEECRILRKQLETERNISHKATLEATNTRNEMLNLKALHETEINQLKEKAQKETNELKSQHASELKELKTDRELIQPLLDIGVAIRLRFLERTRETIWKIPWYKINRNLINRGNIAAHAVDATADMALYHGGFLAGNDALKANFEAFYVNASYDAEDWRAWPEVIRKTCGCVRTLDVMAKLGAKLGFGTGSKYKWQQHQEFVNKIYAAYFDSSGFEDNPNVAGWLKELEVLTLAIIEADRKNVNSFTSRLDTYRRYGNSAEVVQQANRGGKEVQLEGETELAVKETPKAEQEIAPSKEQSDVVPDEEKELQFDGGSTGEYGWKTDDRESADWSEW